MNRKHRNHTLIALLLPALAFAQQDWSTYGGNPAGTRYSTLTQINPKNVAQLKVAWTYDTGDAFRNSEMQCQPIVVHGTLYATTPKLRLIALDAATGKLQWQFDPNSVNPGIGKSRNRGSPIGKRATIAASSSQPGATSMPWTPAPAN